MPAAKKKKEKKKKAKKVAEHKSLWQNYNKRQINTNARVRWKMAALIRQANNWNQMARWKGWWKWWRKIKEKEGWKKNPLLPPDRKLYIVTNSLWQHAMWQRLETRNPCTQYKPHNDANSHWTLNRHSRSKYPYNFFNFFNQFVSTSEAPQGYSHHPHIEKEWNKKQKGMQRKEKQTE